MGPQNISLSRTSTEFRIHRLGSGPWPGFVRIGGVEIRDEFRSMRELGRWKPRGFFIRTFITGPLNQVLEFAFASFVYFGVKNRGDFIFWFPINDDRRVRNGVPTREGIQSCGLDHGDVEDWMDRAHAFW